MNGPVQVLTPGGQPHSLQVETPGGQEKKLPSQGRILIQCVKLVFFAMLAKPSPYQYVDKGLIP